MNEQIQTRQHLPHPTIPALAALREAVLNLGHTRKPKWRFRLADDLILQLQPQSEIVRVLPREVWGQHWESRAAYDAALVEYCRLFKGAAIVGRTDVTAFDQKIPRGPSYVILKFALDAQDSAWLFYFETWHYYYGVDWKLGMPRPPSAPIVAAAVRRVQAALYPDVFQVLDPAQMLAPACVICGKSLTDPASQARLIGPECYGSGSLVVPWVRQLEAVS